MASILVNDTLKNGAKLIKASLHCSFDGHYTGVVFARVSDSTKDYSFATWQIDEAGNTFVGHYFDNYEEARADYFERI